MDHKKVIPLEDRIPKLRIQRKQRSNRRLVFYLSFFFLLLLTVVYFQSPLSDVKNIQIEGNRYVSEEKIVTVSGLNERTSFWGVNKQLIREKLTSLQEISEVTVERVFPNTLQVKIKEFSRVAYLEVEGKYYPILESGNI
jgi:cell division protein FtsQ